MLEMPPRNIRTIDDATWDEQGLHFRVGKKLIKCRTDIASTPSPPLIVALDGIIDPMNGKERDVAKHDLETSRKHYKDELRFWGECSHHVSSSKRPSDTCFGQGGLGGSGANRHLSSPVGHAFYRCCSRQRVSRHCHRRRGTWILQCYLSWPEGQHARAIAAQCAARAPSYSLLWL